MQKKSLSGRRVLFLSSARDLLLRWERKAFRGQRKLLCKSKVHSQVFSIFFLLCHFSFLRLIIITEK